MTAFNPSLIDTTQQIATAPVLEWAFGKLLRNVEVHETIIIALRLNVITDCETFAGFGETEAGMKSNAADFGVDLARGGLSHTREITA